MLKKKQSQEAEAIQADLKRYKKALKKARQRSQERDQEAPPAQEEAKEAPQEVPKEAPKSAPPVVNEKQDVPAGPPGRKTETVEPRPTARGRTKVVYEPKTDAIPIGNRPPIPAMKAVSDEKKEKLRQEE